MHVRIHLTAICVFLLLLLPTTAAIPKTQELTVTAPPGLDWPTIKKVFEDGKVDGGDAVAIAFDTLWSAIGNQVSKTDFCRQATVEASSHTGEFTIPINITMDVGGEKHTQAHVAKIVPTGNGILAVLIPKPGGGYIKWFWCGNGYAYDGPPPADGQVLADTAPNGAERRVFDAPTGKVVVWLPDDVRAGDTISGMVLPSPDGATPDQRSVNRDTLNGYVLEVGGVRTPVKDGLIRLVVPQGAHGLEIALRDRGRTLSRTRVLVGPTALATGPIVPPNYGQAGRAFPVKGQFDGDLQNTQAAIGSQPAMVVAESPRQTVLVAPREPVGATTVAIREGQQHAEGAYRNIGVILTSPKTTLLRGEQTQVNVQVVGLAGISAPVRLRLEATGTVQLQGGNTQLIAIAPSRVDPSGRFTLDLNLRASAAGPFAVTAAVGESPAP